MYLLVAWLVFNLSTFVVYGIDKLKARKSRWRISEATLLWLAALGGAVGAWLGMRVWHHKTLHRKFSVGVPVLLVMQLLLFAWLCR